MRRTQMRAKRKPPPPPPPLMDIRQIAMTRLLELVASVPPAALDYDEPVHDFLAEHEA